MQDITEYYWIAKDEVAAHPQASWTDQQKKQNRYVTPYCILPDALVDAHTGKPCSEFKADTMYWIDLGKTNEQLLGVQRFDKAGYVWEPIEDDLTDAKTIGDLCKRIYDRSAGILSSDYNLENEKAKPMIVRMQSLIFDHKQNTGYRGAYLKKNTPADWSTFDPSSVPIDGRHWWVRRYPIKKHSVPASIGTQQATTESDDIKALDAKGLELWASAKGLADDMQIAEDASRTRLQVLAGLNAIYVLLKCLSYPRGKDEASAKPSGVTAGESQSARLAVDLEKLLPWVKKKIAQTPVSTLSADAELDAKLASVFGTRVQQAKTQVDVLDRIRTQRAALLGMLTADKELAKLLKRLAKKNLDLLAVNPVSAPDTTVMACYGATPEALAMQRYYARLDIVLDVLNEVSGKSDEGEQLFKFLANTPLLPAKSSSDVKGESPLEVLLSMSGRGIVPNTDVLSNVVTLGKYSKTSSKVISVALKTLSVAAYYALPSAAQSATNGGSLGAFRSLRDRVVAEAKKFPDTGEEVDNFLGAVAKGDAQAANDARIAFAKKLVANKEAAPVMACSRVLQIVALFAAVDSAMSQAKDPTVSSSAKVINILSTANTAFATVIGTGETVLKCLGALEDVSKALATLGVGLGAVGSVLGIVSGMVQIVDGLETNNLGMVVSGELSVAGGALEIAALCCEAELCLGPLSIAAIAVTLAGFAVGMLLSDPDVSSINQVANGILRNMKDNPFFAMLLADPNQGTSLANFCFGVDGNGGWLGPAPHYPETYLSWVPNLPVPYDSLRAAGFKDDMIKLVVDDPSLDGTRGAFPGLVLIKAPG